MGSEVRRCESVGMSPCPCGEDGGGSADPSTAFGAGSAPNFTQDDKTKNKWRSFDCRRYSTPTTKTCRWGPRFATSAQDDDGHRGSVETHPSDKNKDVARSPHGRRPVHGDPARVRHPMSVIQSA